MTPLKQRFRHDPAGGVFGDCHRAAIASVLDLPLDEVPHFAADNPDGASFERRAKDWLRSRGLVPINVAYSGDDMPLMFRSVKSMNPGVYYLLGGRSRTGVNHTVVCLDDAIVHDPSPTEAGVVGPCDDGFYWLTFFGTAAAVRAA